MIFIFFLYGLAFFSMGVVVLLEGGRGGDHRLRHALRPLVGFGLIHGTHEWLEMFLVITAASIPALTQPLWEGVRVAMLAFSFLSLTAFGASLMSPTEPIRRLSLLAPLVQAAIWGFGLLFLGGRYPLASGRMWDVADVWSRYVLGIPASLMACIGLIAQQRTFRKAGMAEFGRDSLWAAIAFAWYGLVGQVFTRASPLPPSTVLNQTLFLDWFGFPIQVLRAMAASAAALFVIRFLRAFEVERQRQIAAGQIIVIGTDGIWETCNAEGAMFGKEALQRIIRSKAKKPAHKIVSAVIDAVNRFRSTREQEDDITLVVIKIA